MIARERIRAAIPMRELERRWAAVRKGMKAAGIDVLVMQNDNQWLGGYVRYFMDNPAEFSYPTTVIFPLNDEMTVINHGAPDKPLAPPEWYARGIKSRLAQPYFRNVYYTNPMDAEETVKLFKARGDKRVGIVGLGTMSAAYYLYLKENLPGVELVEVSDMVDRIKAEKSADELVFVRKAAETQDMACAAMPTMIRPGKWEYQLRGEIMRMLMDLGSEQQLIRLRSVPAGQPAATTGPFYQNRQMQWGDQIIVLIETNGPGGFYAEICRTWFLGDPPQELLKVWDLAAAAQKLGASVAKPGAHPGDILKQSNEFMISRGMPPEGRLNAHGQGYDLVERPLCLADEPMLLEADMVLAIHPAATTATAYAMCCDDYLITANGAERLHKTPQQVGVISC
jgi:Xaa-Pro aminopeptidase